MDVLLCFFKLAILEPDIEDVVRQTHSLPT
jgi:hypothetical protein